MSDRVSALAGASGGSYVTVAEAGLQGMITIRGDLGDRAFQKAVTGVSGTSMPAPLTIETGTRSLGWMSPDELLLLCPYQDAESLVEQLTDALQGTHHMVVNVSDARAVFKLTGPWKDAVARVAPIDLRDFTDGALRRTRFAQVPAAVWAHGDTAQIVCFRSVAQYMFDLLSDASSKGPLTQAQT